MRADVVLFDLDGTLTASAPGVTRSVAYALDALGLPPLDEATLARFVGPPLGASFRAVAGLDEPGAREAVAAYRAYFERQGMFENSVYPGVLSLLRALVADGRRLAITTSKPLRYAIRIAEHFGLSDYFELIRGPETDSPHETKGFVVRDTISRLGVEPNSGVVLAGDRSHDVVGAHEAGIRCIGVLWGYGDRAELLAAGADEIVPDVACLARVLGVVVDPQDEESAGPSASLSASLSALPSTMPSVGDEALA